MKSLLLLSSLFCILLSLACSNIQTLNEVDIYNEDIWAAQLDKESAHRADEIAAEHGLVNQGRLPLDENIFIFKRSKSLRKRGTEAALSADPSILWFEKQVPRLRAKRNFVDPTDPLYHSQWHIQNTPGRDINVAEAWRLGYSGKGVTVCIVDDGVQKLHPDIVQNFRDDGSYDFNFNKVDPEPAYFDSHGTESGGTACASKNDICGVGIAFNANLTGVKILGGPVTDFQEAQGLGFKVEDINDVMSNSWGPDDDGNRLEGPGTLSQKAIEKGITKGRRGLGTIYMWAAGNGKRRGDNCNYDGYANSRYTITIGSIDHDGKPAWYSEPCSALVAVTPSSGTPGFAILTTDLRGPAGASRDDCSRTFGGTSASSPMAAGMIALILEAKSTLTWRDVRNIVIECTAHLDPGHTDWQVNKAGFKVNHFYGFGRLDAGKAVKLAANWTLLPAEQSVHSPVMASPVDIPAGGKVSSPISVPSNPLIIEHIDIKVVATTSHRGKLLLSLVSPSGVTSRLAEERSDWGANVDWTFSTLFNYGESLEGTWNLVVENRNGDTASLRSWELIFWGH
eukprot:TRINITY_DN4904_c0_g1_i1.p1 TRINITY_DN4904_c0_g1~~TRINITY_DN4904_c0_g1_i1.p1  ORF type:complete len:566 (-),score=119.66 TRINITY_DN4904_c0_g1_i1:615-2312(-)